ncbi:MAG: hypothetical protein ACOCV3_00500 [Halanaerobiales bacterium]
MGFQAENYKGEKIINSGGIIIVLFYLLYYILSINLKKVNSLQWSGLIFILMITASVGVIDDICGGRNEKGFKGHIKKLWKGKLSTGVMKAIAVTTSAIIVLLYLNNFKLTNVTIIIFSANLFNLLDLRPGRALKVFILMSVFLLVFYPQFILYFLPIYIISIVYLPLEFKKIMMLGDSGSNSLGIILGWSIINISHTLIKINVLLLFFILNILAEKISFTKIIEKNRYLNWVDQIGR